MEYKPTSTANYEDMDEKIELTSKWAHFILAELSATGVVIPLSILSFINYFAFNMGENSFILPFPML